MTAGRNNAEVLSQHWCTPPKYVDAIREFFSGSVVLDPCSNRHSTVRATVEYSLPEIDGLSARGITPPSSSILHTAGTAREAPRFETGSENAPRLTYNMVLKCSP